jgi:amidohydrolase
MKIIKAIAAATFLFAGSVMAQDLPTYVNGQLPGLVDIYKGLHTHPELSHHEEQSSALLAAELRKAGFTVTEHVGKYPDGTQAFGVVAILKNGDGPKLLIRSDMDALPIVEETGLPYASHVTTKNASGQEVGVMHACGHDIHMTNLIGVARTMAAMKNQWHGTLMLIGQPSEETIDGAKAMLADHLYERFGTPDMAIALHDTNLGAAGTLSVTPGASQASSTSVDVTMRGIGGHGSAPQAGKDPIVMAAEFIVQLQTIVSRQEDPHDLTVVTVGDIHGGTKRNIIPDEVKMELTVRTFTDKSLNIALDGIRRTAQGVALSAGVPEDRAPIVTIKNDETTPVNYNDPALTARVKSTLVKTLGAQNVIDGKPLMGSEDFGVLGLDGHRIPTFMFWLGAMDPTKFAAAEAAGKSLPGTHTNRFEPLPEPTLRTGIVAMSSVAISLLQN